MLLLDLGVAYEWGGAMNTAVLRCYAYSALLGASGTPGCYVTGDTTDPGL